MRGAGIALLFFASLALFPHFASAGQGGPSALGPHSALLFLQGARNPNTRLSSGVEDYRSIYGEGRLEPSLASVEGSSLLKRSSPLLTATSVNSRTEVTPYTVQPGDAPSIIAASFGITTNTILWANNLSDGKFIKPGDELLILPVSGVRHKVRAGDTISSIAKLYKGDAQIIIDFNDLGGDASIVEGDYIIIPDGEMPARLAGSRYVARYSPYSLNFDDYFIHPTAGVGYRSRGLHPHNAVDWAAPCWTPIYAAAEGTVAISDGVGWNGGYGKYIKIEHPNGVRTIYGHNIKNQVQAGQYVAQGELIAYMGSTGRSTGCHTHWEVYGALNPLR